MCIRRVKDLPSQGGIEDGIQAQADIPGRRGTANKGVLKVRGFTWTEMVYPHVKNWDLSMFDAFFVVSYATQGV